MFPIPWNFPFRKKNGDISTIGAEISGGGSTYTLPTASESTKGGVKIGAGLTMEGEVLKNTNPTPAIPYVLPTASDETLGGIKVGSGLSIIDGVLSVVGGGGSSVHLYKVSTGVISYNEIFLLTPYNGEINNKATFVEALEHGFGIITSGYMSGDSTKAPAYIYYSSASNAKVVCRKATVESGTSNYATTDASIPNTMNNISATKIF